MLTDVSLEVGLAAVLERITPLAGEAVPLLQALNRIAARDLSAARDLPSHRQSSMDGYALHGDDLGQRDNFTLQKCLRNGEWPDAPLLPGQAVGVVTGGPLPEGTGAVAVQESVTVQGEQLFLAVPPRLGANIKLPGEDFLAGDLLAKAGARLDPGLLAVLAAFGTGEVFVYRRPQVAILSLGNEIVPGHMLPLPGQLWDSNGPLLAALAMGDGAEVVSVAVAGDSCTGGVRERMSELLEQADLLLTVGGGAFGICDHALAELQGIGTEILFWGVDIKPGSHSGAAVWRSKPVLSLSGNPAACAVGYYLLAAPVIRSFQGLNPYLERVTAVCIDDFPRSGGPRRFLRALAACRDTGWQVTLQPGQKNSMLRSLVGCNALVELPAGHQPLQPGSPVSVLLLH
ncbi:MAG: molybdopterin molybdotransferase MoeA [Firmicutes bacterium]|nr:molybdopterin molybdotransferase MoeA [Bacillota bacterium]